MPRALNGLVLSTLFAVGCAAATNGGMDQPKPAAPPASDPSPAPVSTTSVGDTETPGCESDRPDLRGCACDNRGATRACYTGPAGTAHKGICKDGQQTCKAVGELMVWGDCTGDVTPQAEVCSDTLDHNCNGVVGCEDSSCTGLAGCCMPAGTRSCYDGPAGTAGVGACKSGTQTCDSQGAWQTCAGQVQPSPEAGHCNDGVDDDCNGLTDCQDPACTADPACKPRVCDANATKSCYDGPTATAGVGQCRAGSLSCDSAGQWTTTCVGEIVPGTEAGHCHDGVDNDCDGKVDCQDEACNGDPGCTCTPGSTRSCYTGPAGTVGVGACTAGTQTCNAGGTAWGPCTGDVTPRLETGLCDDGIDNDCNGVADCADPACTFATNCCVPTTSYDQTIYATSATDLYQINPSDWSETKIGSYGVTEHMTDIGMTPDGNLYTVSSTSLYHINRTTGAATFVIKLTGSLNNAITFLNDNRLLAADASGMLKVIDPVAKTVTNIGSYGNGYTSSGDLVAVGDGTMFGVSANAFGGASAATNNILVKVNTSTGAATAIGPTGFGDVFGLAYYKSRVIAFTGSGQILEIDPATGAGKLLSTQSNAFYGGTTSPLIPINGCR
jgi:hypothetical protein